MVDMEAVAEPEWVPLAGEAVPPDALHSSTAQALASLLARGYPFATLVGTWTFPAPRGEEAGRDGVIFDVDVEVSQHPVNDIRRVERIVAAFLPDVDGRPEPLALRADFPHVPHLNNTQSEYPKSLCLSDQPWEDERLTWTPARFVEAVRTWFARTASGDLHRGDQALEPLLGGAHAKIVLPFDLFEASDAPEPLLCDPISQGETGDVPLVIVARRDSASSGDANKSALPFVAVPLGVSAPMTHGIIRWQPATLFELHDFLKPTGADLLGKLRGLLKTWVGDPEMLNRKPIFVIALQKRRTDDGRVESTETWALQADKTLADIQVAIGVHAEEGGFRGMLLHLDNAKQGEDVRLFLLLPYFTLSRDKAAQLNGLAEADRRKVVAIGLGALGSQVFNNLARAGFGQWTLVDDDHLLPHNLARHTLHGGALGYAKVSPLAIYANLTFAPDSVATPLALDVLRPRSQAEALLAACAEAEVLLDMSASVSVARHLARDRDDASARRVSLFLNPSGTDVVLLAEDAGRRHRLDVLEMQYYRALASLPELAGHLRSPEGQLRYGRSCRDVTSRLPQDQVALHAAIGSRAVRAAVNDPHACIKVWRSSEDLTVSSISLPVYAVEEVPIAEWTLVSDSSLLDRVRDIRAAKAPVETGGVLLGSFDMQRRIVYVAGLIVSPPDSVERADLYIRGQQGLRDAVAQASAATAGWLRYVGEWHSHPPGMNATPSKDDHKLFGWLSDMLLAEGTPPVMLICGENEHRWFVEEIPLVARGKST